MDDINAKLKKLDELRERMKGLTGLADKMNDLDSFKNQLDSLQVNGLTHCLILWFICLLLATHQPRAVNIKQPQPPLAFLLLLFFSHSSIYVRYLSLLSFPRSIYLLFHSSQRFRS